MKPPIDPRHPGGEEQPPERASGGRRGPRPGGHGSYKIGGEPATGHRWSEAPPPPPAPSGRYVPPAAAATGTASHANDPRYDDGVSHEPHAAGDPLHNEDVAHEHSDINVRAVIMSAIILAVVVGISQLLMWGLFGVFEKMAAANDPQLSPHFAPPSQVPANTVQEPVFSPDTFAGPQLLTNEPGNLQRHRETEQTRLQGFGWVDQGAGVAHMPLENAKKLLVERGLPVREGEAAAPNLGTGLPARGEASGGRTITAPVSAEPVHETQPPPPAVTPGQEGQRGHEGPSQPATQLDGRGNRK